jgi:hypothetical protein
MVVEINDFPTEDRNQVDTVLISLASSPTSAVTTGQTELANQVGPRKMICLVLSKPDQIMRMIEKTMEKVCEGKEKIEA